MAAAVTALSCAPRGVPVEVSSSAPVVDDETVVLIAEQTLHLRTLDPCDPDDEDLKGLEHILGEARVVNLGEATHGDGAAFLAKTRLVKYLHQRLGFDVLVLESSLYTCTKMWSALVGGAQAYDAAALCVFDTWKESAQMQPLFEYLADNARTDHPLAVWGMDPQLSGSASNAVLLHDIEQVFGEERVREFAATHHRLLDVMTRRSPEQTAADEASLRSLRQSVESLPHEEAPFWRRVVEGMLYMHEDHRLFHENGRKVAVRALNLRDEEMARNLIWLALERFPDRKLIVWSASIHGARAVPQEERATPREVMGEFVSAELGDAYSSVGFLAYEGAYRVVTDPRTYTLERAAPDSLEGMFVAAGIENGILGLRGAPFGPFERPLVARPMGYETRRASWPAVFDAVVFIRTMTPSTPTEARTGHDACGGRSLE
jgi:erythromycin esterase